LFSEPDVETFSHVRTDGWQAAIRIPLDQISVNCQFRQPVICANLAVIAGSQPQRFLSVATPPSSVEPDFHLHALRCELPVLTVVGGRVNDPAEAAAAAAAEDAPPTR
jgi:hypothetical protein